MKFIKTASVSPEFGAYTVTVESQLNDEPGERPTADGDIWLGANAPGWIFRSSITIAQARELAHGMTMAADVLESKLREQSEAAAGVRS